MQYNISDFKNIIFINFFYFNIKKNKFQSIFMYEKFFF